MNFLKSALLLLPFIIVTYATNAGLVNVGNSCYMNTALQAFASIPAVSNIILSVDSETLANKYHGSLLLKLQTILYALRSDKVRLSDGYLREFRDAISVVSNHTWNAGRQED